MLKKEGHLDILTGNALIYYCFDVGTHIDIDEAERRLGKGVERSSLTLERITPNGIQYRKKPLLVRLGHIPITQSLMLEGIAKIYDFGVITIRIRMPLHGAIDEKTCRSLQNKFVQKAATDAYEQIHAKIADTIERPYDHAGTFEDYTLIHVEKFTTLQHGADILATHGKTIAQMLRCEDHELSAMELADAIKTPISYYADDLAIIDSGAAFIYSPRHEYDVHDVIEYAIIELLELRHYDAVLDNVLERAHDDISNRRFRLKGVSRLHRELSHVRIQITDVIEKVENSLKLIGDMYLVKIYSTASDRFGLPQWKTSVREKLQTLQGTYTMLTDRISANRLMLLEIIVAISSALYLIEFFLRYITP